MAAETEESGGQDKNGRVGMYRRAMCKRHGEKSLVFTTSHEILRTCEEPENTECNADNKGRDGARCLSSFVARSMPLFLIRLLRMIKSFSLSLRYHVRIILVGID